MRWLPPLHCFAVLVDRIGIPALWLRLTGIPFAYPGKQSRRGTVRTLAVILVVVAALASTGTAQGHGDRLDHMTYQQLYRESKRLISNGAIYSTAYGVVHPRLKQICYEMLERKFGGRYWFAYAVMQQESDCNPGAHNFKWSGWHNQAQGIAQMIPKYHTWVNFKKLKHDLHYAIACFYRLSRGGTNGQPWGM